MLDPVSEKKIATLRDQIVAAFGDDLLSLALFGSAAGADFVPGQSDINLAIVFKNIGFGQLQTLQRELPAWRQAGAATPILLDLDFLSRAVDVFPIEFQDIQDRHRILHGSDPFSDITIDPGHLRFQLEQEARGKLLRLRLAFIESSGDDEQLESLIQRSLKSFVSLIRSLNRWRSGTLTLADREMLEHFTREFGLDVPVLRRLVQVRLQQEKWWAKRSDIFAEYLREVERLVDLVDRLDMTR